MLDDCLITVTQFALFQLLRGNAYDLLHMQFMIHVYTHKRMRSLWYDRPLGIFKRRFQIWNHLHATSHHLQGSNDDTEYTKL